MGLVGYSDSEGSDEEVQVSVSSRPKVKVSKPGAIASKSGFQKVVDRSNPRKIQVQLSGSEAQAGEKAPPAGYINGPSASDARPTKRARTAGAFSDFNSLLPAPKNAAKSAITTSSAADGGNGRMSRARGTGLGAGINLRTGAAPAFSRSQDAEDTYSRAMDGDMQSDYTPTTSAVAAPPATGPEVKLLGKPMMFKPLSVARKPAKKKIIPVEAATAVASNTDGGKASQQTTVPKAKKSLFSTNVEDITSEPVIPSRSGYVPLDAEVPVSQPIENDAYAIPASDQSNAQQPCTLGALADSLALTAAQRRQLFGRNGGQAAAQIANFDLSAEYMHNNELRESGDTAPLHNPVRSIAPGKHSLQQLMNMATNQKDALEESFAQGKNNRRDAGSKYGW